MPSLSYRPVRGRASGDQYSDWLDGDAQPQDAAPSHPMDSDEMRAEHRRILQWYYLERDKPTESDPVQDHEDWRRAMEAARNKLEIIVAKQRQGEIGTAHVRFNPALNLIWEDGR